MEDPKTRSQQPQETSSERCYTAYAKQESHDFCPLTDLNFPASYEEVIKRFEKLQGDKAMEVMN